MPWVKRQEVISDEEATAIAQILADEIGAALEGGDHGDVAEGVQEGSEGRK